MPKKLRFADEIGGCYRDSSMGVVKFYNDGLVQAVMFASLIY